MGNQSAIIKEGTYHHLLLTKNKCLLLNLVEYICTKCIWGLIAKEKEHRLNSFNASTMGDNDPSVPKHQSKCTKINQLNFIPFMSSVSASASDDGRRGVRRRERKRGGRGRLVA
jgi:hypothetical protein